VLNGVERSDQPIVSYRVRHQVAGARRWGSPRDAVEAAERLADALRRTGRGRFSTGRVQRQGRSDSRGGDRHRPRNMRCAGSTSEDAPPTASVPADLACCRDLRQKGMLLERVAGSTRCSTSGATDGPPSRAGGQRQSYSFLKANGRSTASPGSGGRKGSGLPRAGSSLTPEDLAAVSWLGPSTGRPARNALRGHDLDALRFAATDRCAARGRRGPRRRDRGGLPRPSATRSRCSSKYTCDDGPVLPAERGPPARDRDADGAGDRQVEGSENRNCSSSIAPWFSCGRTTSAGLSYHSQGPSGPTRSSGTTRRCRRVRSTLSRTRTGSFRRTASPRSGCCVECPRDGALVGRGHPAGWWNPILSRRLDLCSDRDARSPRAGLAWGKKLKGEARARSCSSRRPTSEGAFHEGANSPGSRARRSSCLQQQRVGDLDAVEAQTRRRHSRQGGRLRDAGVRVDGTDVLACFEATHEAAGVRATVKTDADRGGLVSGRSARDGRRSQRVCRRGAGRRSAEARVCGRFEGICGGRDPARRSCCLDPGRAADASARRSRRGGRAARGRRARCLRMPTSILPRRSARISTSCEDTWLALDRRGDQRLPARRAGAGLVRDGAR